MARMIVCDHCKRIIEEEDPTTVHMMMGMEALRADLCASCSKDLELWLQGKDNRDDFEDREDDDVESTGAGNS